MTYKCKICGGQTTIDTLNGIAICDYCGTKQALPLFTDDSERMLYERGNNYLSHSEYDKAENVFNQLLTIKPNAAELYWDLVLCKFGVTYVKDPKTGKYIPTCNRTHYTPIFLDENYKKAIELSSGEKKTLFEEDAKTIDNIQKGIIAVSKKEKPFDIFISYKETDANGNRSKDSIEAQKLYEKLTEAGYKVFFSRITLEDKVGTEYEPYIYAALYSSKVMVTICSSKENIEAVWVKNEWSRFLQLRQNDNSKTLLPLYFDMDKEDLPEEFSLIPSFNIKEEGFEAELLRGIKKQIPLPVMIAQKRKARKKTLTISALSFLAVILVCGIVFLPGAIKNFIYGDKYDEAMQLFKSQNYTGAKAVFETITDYKDAAYMIERCERQPEYDKAMQFYYDGKYAQSAWAFAALGDYEDASEQKQKAENSWKNSLATVCAYNYYITENGTVTTLKDALGSSHKDVDISKNGKVVSIAYKDNIYAAYGGLTAIHENGNITNLGHNNEIVNNPEWHNIIKVSENFGGAQLIGLRTDGKLVILATGEHNLDDLLTWTEIIDFQESYEPGNGANEGFLIGLKADGTLCATYYSDYPEGYDFDMKDIEEVLSKFSNVKKFVFSNDMYSGLKLLALTNDNKLVYYSNGKYNELNESDVCDIAPTDSYWSENEVTETTLALKSNGDVVELKTGKVLIHDIVHVNAGHFAITRNGNIVKLKKDYSTTQWQVKQTGSKTAVREEWVARLK